MVKNKGIWIYYYWAILFHHKQFCHEYVFLNYCSSYKALSSSVRAGHIWLGFAATVWNGDGKIQSFKLSHILRWNVG